MPPCECRSPRRSGVGFGEAPRFRRPPCAWGDSVPLFDSGDREAPTPTAEPGAGACDDLEADPPKSRHAASLRRRTRLRDVSQDFGRESSPGDDTSSCSEVCAICLGSGCGDEAEDGPEEGAPRLRLACGHSFCKAGISRHVRNRQGRRRVSCPVCRAPLTAEDIAPLPADDTAGLDLSDLGEPIAEPPRPGPVDDILMTRHYRRLARRAHMKMCPSCGAHIVKDGGCNHMNCAWCGHDFNWDEAQTVVSCRRLHLSSSWMGTTCPGCSHIAKAKLAAYRTGLGVAAVPAGAAAVAAGTATAAGAVAVAAVPAVVCAPCAVAYEPVRRLRGRRHNPFAKGMYAGVGLLCMAVFVMTADTDDD